MKVIPGNAQHIGTRREQQDDFGFSDLNDREFVSHGGILAIITDGMGGLALGREAGRVAKQTMLREYEAKAPEESVPAALKRALEAANVAVYELSCQVGQEGEVGTTLAAAVIKDRELHWVSVGDSRIYLYCREELFQLTTDHDYGRELALMAEAGKVTWEEALSDPNRRALTSYLGLPQLAEVDHSAEPVPLEAGDRVMLCSDGLYGSLSIEEMVEFLEADAQEAAELLIEGALVKEKSSQDNLTVAILACEGESLFHRLANLPIIPDFRWRHNWRQVTSAALIGALLTASGIWAVGKYWHSTKPISQVAKETAAQREGSKPTAEVMPAKLEGPAKPAQEAGPSNASSPAGGTGATNAAAGPPPISTVPPLKEKVDKEPTAPPDPKASPEKAEKQKSSKIGKQNKNKGKDKKKEKDNKTQKLEAM